MIQLRNVRKSFGSKTILRDISLDLENGKTHVFLGSSGCGKSTLLRIILGLLDADSGQVALDELQVSSQTQRELAGRCGYVIQDGGLFPHLSARANIYLRAHTLGLTTPAIDEHYDKLWQDFRLPPEVAGRFPSQLSGGQRQRVGLIRALLLDPDYLFLDEPLSALDPIVRSHLQEELRNLFREIGKTVVIVTHDIAEAAYLADTVTLMRQGEIIQHGSMQDLLQKPKDRFVNEFINAQRTEMPV